MGLNETNLLYGCNGEVSQTIPKPESYAFAAIMFLIIGISIFGNCLIITAIYRIQTLQTPTNALLCSLAITDLLAPNTRILSLAISMVMQRWVFGCNWCIASSTLGIFFSSSSINHLCLISIERCITIRHPYQAKNWITKRNVAMAIILVWIVSLLMSMLPFFGVGLVRFHSYLLNCEVYLEDDPKLGLLLGGMYFAIPFMVMLIVYGLILSTVRSQAKLMCTYSVGSREEKQKQKFKTEIKAMKTVLVVVGIFFLLWSPYFCTSAIEPFQPEMIPPWWKRLNFTLVYLNSCCNWIVYGVRNKKMRSAFKNVLGFN